MIPQPLAQSLEVFRIGDPKGRFPIWDAIGSTVFPGRWNSGSSPVIYAAQSYSLAMLEKLAHLNGILPDGQHYVRAILPAKLSILTVTPALVPGWDSDPPVAARRLGDRFVAEGLSAVLRVPSFVARIEWNFVINPRHPDFGMITTFMPEPVWWDERLFARI
ncbi:MAG: RES domain-containing protein [Alphaproteobacteria bacterium]|nr:RES domain-containing protein [Alphaproteobacteria bacterium]